MKEKLAELKQQPELELQHMLKEAETKLMKLSFQHNATPLQNPMQLRITRRQVARLKTILRERELQSKTQ